VERYRQAGQFRVRQREQLRRALQKAAVALDWDVIAGVEENPIQEVAIDVHRLTGAGVRAIERDIESEIAEKRREVSQLKRTVQALSKLADEDPAAFPTEVAYRYTASRGKDVYVTKEEELVVEDPGSAEMAALKLEKSLDRFGRLRDQMVESLKQRRRTVREAKAELHDFMRVTDSLVADVLATLS
jgi:hypothetical protein